MIRARPFVIAALPPVALRARLTGFRHRLRSRVVGAAPPNRFFQPAHRMSDVVDEVGCLERRDQAVAEDDPHGGREPALCPGEEVGVKAELHGKLRLHKAGQLRVVHLVRPRAEIRRGVHADQKVGEAVPAAPVPKDGLEDEIGPTSHRFLGGPTQRHPVQAGQPPQQSMPSARRSGWPRACRRAVAGGPAPRPRRMASCPRLRCSPGNGVLSHGDNPGRCSGRKGTGARRRCTDASRHLYR